MNRIATLYKIDTLYESECCTCEMRKALMRESRGNYAKMDRVCKECPVGMQLKELGKMLCR